MSTHLRAFLAVATLALACGAARCDNCVPVPCLPPAAIMIFVTSTSGEPIRGASAEVSGISGAIPCVFGSESNVCRVPGSARTYDVRITAAGYQPATQSIVVTDRSGGCGCDTVNSRTVTIALTAA